MCYLYVTHYTPCQHTYGKDTFCALAGENPFENPEDICDDIYDNGPVMNIVGEYCGMCKQINRATRRFAANPANRLTKWAANAMQRDLDITREGMLECDGVPIENTSEALDIGLGEPLHFSPAYVLPQIKKGKGLKVAFANTSNKVLGSDGGLEWADDDSVLDHERTHMHEVPKGMKVNDLIVLQIAAWYTDRKSVGDQYGLALIRNFWAQDTDQKRHKIEKLHDWLHSEADMAVDDPNKPMGDEVDGEYETGSEGEGSDVGETDG